MRRWWVEARSAAGHVADHAGAWLPGAVVWCLTLGWFPLFVTVARPPSVTDLTFLGARIYTSGSWPWNAVAVAGGALLLLLVGFVLVAAAEAALLARASRRAVGPGTVGRLLGIGFVAAAPVLAALLATGTAAVVVAMREFPAPTPGDPVVRTIVRITPFLVVTGVAWLIASLVHAVAARATALGGAGFVVALIAVPRRLAAAGMAALVHGVLFLLLRLGYAGSSTMLLGVLWAPIGMRLDRGPIDAATTPLLVGFVAIWLCLVLGGGALHAWGSLTWTRILGTPAPGAGGAQRHAQGDRHRS